MGGEDFASAHKIHKCTKYYISLFRRIYDEALTFKRFYSILFKCHAGMAELADAHGSGPCEYYFRGGSSPLACTIKNRYSSEYLFFIARGREPEKAWSGKKTIADGFQRHGPKPCAWARAEDFRRKASKSSCLHIQLTAGESKACVACTKFLSEYDDLCYIAGHRFFSNPVVAVQSNSQSNGNS